MKTLIGSDGAVLAAWARRSENSKGTTDAWIKFYLSDEALLDAVLARFPGEDDFRGGCKSGGSLVELTLHEYDDLEHTPPQFEEQKAPLKASQKSALICKDLMFPKYCRRFLDEYLQAMKKENLFNGTDTTEDIMAEIVRYICSIKSRGELDTNEGARHLFNTVIEQPFWEYKKQQEKL